MEAWLQDYIPRAAEMFSRIVSKMSDKDADTPSMKLEFTPRQVLEHLQAGDQIAHEFVKGWVFTMLIEAARDGEPAAVEIMDKVDIRWRVLLGQPRFKITVGE